MRECVCVEPIFMHMDARTGTKVADVQQVLTNCFISKLEVRTEQDEDVKVAYERESLCVCFCQYAFPRA